MIKDERPTFDPMEQPQGCVSLEVTNLSKSLSERLNDPTKLDDLSTFIRGTGRPYQERGTP
jgi:hypothetical protein